MTGYDPAFEDSECVDRLDAGSHPVSDVRAGADAVVSIFDQGQDVVRVPIAVARFVRSLRMIVKPDLDVELLDHRLDGVHGVRRFRIDHFEAETLRPREELSRLHGIFGDARNAVGGRCQSKAIHLRLQLVRRIVAHFRPHDDVGTRFQLLTGKELDILRARLGGFLDRFERGEPIEAPSLNPDHELGIADLVTAGLVVSRVGRTTIAKGARKDP